MRILYNRVELNFIIKTHDIDLDLKSKEIK